MLCTRFLRVFQKCSTSFITRLHRKHLLCSRKPEKQLSDKISSKITSKLRPTAPVKRCCVLSFFFLNSQLQSKAVDLYSGDLYSALYDSMKGKCFLNTKVLVAFQHTDLKSATKTLGTFD